LRGLGYAEGKNLVLEWRSADGRYERLPALAAELAKANVDVIVTHGTPGTKAAQQATSTIPIVTIAVADPIGNGFAQSLGRPGGNVTGLTTAMVDVSGKQVDILRLLVPKASRFGMLLNLGNPAYEFVLKETAASADRVGITLVPIDVRAVKDLGRVFGAMKDAGINGLMVANDPLFYSGDWQRAIVSLAAKHQVPAAFQSREFVVAGGLMSYGESLVDFYARAASYVDKVLKGARPADLPFEQPTKFHLAINRKAAQALDLAIPAELLTRADEVIN